MNAIELLEELRVAGEPLKSGDSLVPVKMMFHGPMLTLECRHGTKHKHVTFKVEGTGFGYVPGLTRQLLQDARRQVAEAVGLSP